MRNSFSASLGDPVFKFAFRAASAALAVLLAEAEEDVDFAALLALPRVNRRVPEICMLSECLEDRHGVRNDSVRGRIIGGCVIASAQRMVRTNLTV